MIGLMPHPRSDRTEREILVVSAGITARPWGNDAGGGRRSTNAPAGRSSRRSFPGIGPESHITAFAGEAGGRPAFDLVGTEPGEPVLGPADETRAAGPEPFAQVYADMRPSLATSLDLEHPELVGEAIERQATKGRDHEGEELDHLVRAADGPELGGHRVHLTVPRVPHRLPQPMEHEMLDDVVDPRHLERLVAAPGTEHQARVQGPLHVALGGVQGRELRRLPPTRAVMSTPYRNRDRPARVHRIGREPTNARAQDNSGDER